LWHNKPRQAIKALAISATPVFYHAAETRKEMHRHEELEPPKSARLALWLLGCIIAYFVCMLFYGPFIILSAPWFPLGLFYFFDHNARNDFLLTFLGWVIYLPLTLALFRIRHRWRFYVVYGVFLTLLCLNAVGCHKAIEHAPIGTLS
jgi:hypothetical protein